MLRILPFVTTLHRLIFVDSVIEKTSSGKGSITMRKNYFERSQKLYMSDSSRHMAESICRMKAET
jgi:hypothetical protein